MPYFAGDSSHYNCPDWKIVAGLRYGRNGVLYGKAITDVSHAFFLDFSCETSLQIDSGIRKPRVYSAMIT